MWNLFFSQRLVVVVVVIATFVTLTQNFIENQKQFKVKEICVNNKRKMLTNQNYKKPTTNQLCFVLILNTYKNCVRSVTPARKTQHATIPYTHSLKLNSTQVTHSHNSHTRNVKVKSNYIFPFLYLFSFHVCLYNA